MGNETASTDSKPTRRSLIGYAALGPLALIGKHSLPARAMGTPPLRQDNESSSRWFYEPQDQAMINWLGGDQQEWQILDAGCGRGNHVQLFAEKFHRGHVAAVDLNPERIREIEQRFKGTKYQHRVLPRVADIQQLPFEEGTFDLAWSSHTLHILADPIAAVRELVRVVRSGGGVAVREDHFLSRLLPLDVGLGEPGLEERAVGHFINGFARDRVQRGRVPFGWIDVLRNAGLHNVSAQSFLFERTPPFSDTEIEHLRERMIRRMIREETSPEDRASIEQLADPKSPHDFGRRTDLHFVSVSTVYWGIAE